MRALLALIALIAIGAAVLFWRQTVNLQGRLEASVASAQKGETVNSEEKSDQADKLDRGLSRGLNGVDALAKAFAGLKTGPDQAALRTDIEHRLAKLTADLTPAAEIARAMLLAAQPPGFKLDPAGISDDANAAFLAKADADPSFTKTSSGLRYKVIKAGNGPKPAPGSEVTVNYKGRFIEGTQFDASDKNPVTFPLNQLIPAWSEGIPLMNEGATFEFVVPYDLAYGAAGRGPIPGRQTLIFDVDLIKVATPAGPADQTPH